MAVSIAEIIILSIVADWAFRQIRVPGLIGILLVGILLGPQVLGQISPDLLAIGSDLRMIALIVILLRAGFELSRKTLRRVGGKSLLLAFVPATCEGLAITLIGPALLGLTFLESAVLGSVLAAVSPAVVVPRMIGFIKERRGAKKAIPSMVLAAASVDDVYVIVVHTVLVGLYVGRRMNLAWEITAVPLSLVLGAAAGLGVGWLLYRIFERSDLWATKQVLIVIACAIFLVRLQYYLAGVVPFAGLVAAMAIGFVILERRERIAHAISARLARVWIFAEIILFSMVGAQVNVAVAWRAGLAGIAVILVGVAARSSGVLVCLAGSDLTRKERIFTAVAFTPKATVQAAIGASPLLAMRAAGMTTGPGEVILAVAVLSILLTAPAGSWAISALGRRWLAVEPEAGENAYRAAVESSG